MSRPETGGVWREQARGTKPGSGHASPVLESGLCCVGLRKSLSLSGPAFLLWKMRSIIELIHKAIKDTKCCHKGYKVLPSTERALKNHTAL